MKKIAVLLLAIVMIASLAACSSEKASHNDAGYYTAFSITEDGETMTQAELEEYGIDIYLELKEDGTGVLNIAGDESQLTWQDGSLTAEGETVSYVVAGGMLTLDLSDDDDEFIMIFKKAAKPEAGSSSSLKGLLNGAGADAPAEEPAEAPDEAPAAQPAAQGGDFEPVGGYVEDGYIEIVAAEHFTDIDGKDAIRFYYDFTNESDEIKNCAWNYSFYAEQSGLQLVDTYDNWEDDVPEYGNDSRYILPGVTIRCIAEYRYLPTGGPVTFSISDYEDGEVVAVFDPENLPGRLGDWEPEPLASLFTEGLSDEIDIDDLYLFIDTAEYAEPYFDDEELVRIYFTYTNNSDEEESCYMAANIYIFQDGISLSSGTSSEGLESDELFYEYIQPGETVNCSSCWELREDSDDLVLEVVVFDYSGEVLGGTWYSNS